MVQAERLRVGQDARGERQDRVDLIQVRRASLSPDRRFRIIRQPPGQIADPQADPAETDIIDALGDVRRSMIVGVLAGAEEQRALLVKSLAQVRYAETMVAAAR